jgi:argininosuccinate lyase
MLAELVPNLKVSSNASEKALTSFVAATELTNLIVRKYDVPFRVAHKIVGAFVKTLLETKRTFIDATPKLLQETAKNAAGIDLTVKREDLAELADLMKIVKKHKVKGGPAPAEVKRALTTRKKTLALSKSHIWKMKQALAEAEKRLQLTVKSMSSTSSHENGRFKNTKL